MRETEEATRLCSHKHTNLKSGVKKARPLTPFVDLDPGANLQPQSVPGVEAEARGLRAGQRGDGEVK